MIKTPQSQDAEKGLLSCMMIAPERVIPDFIERQGREEYFLSRHHVISYRQLAKMWQDKAHIDAISVTNALEDAGALEAVGGVAYVTELSIFVPAASGAREYAEILREKWIAREAILLSDKIREEAYNGTQSLQGIVQEGLVKVAGMFESNAKTLEMPDLIRRALDRAEEQKMNGGAIQGITTGIAEFDIACRGFKPGQMITIAAPTKQGKSALALNIAMHNVLRGNPVAVFSLEMDADELTDRLISSHSQVDMGRVAGGRTDPNETDRFVKAGCELSGAPLFIRDEAVMSPLQFQAAARKLHAQHGCKLIVVDYLQLMDGGNGEDDSREREVARCSRAIKTTAKELGVPIIVLAQLNDWGRSRESRAIEQDSDLFVVIEEDKTSGDPSDMYIHIKFGRNVPRTRVPVTFQSECVKFTGREAQ